MACVSTLGGSAAETQQQSLPCYYSPEINVNGKQRSNTNGSREKELTEHIDEGVGQEVTIVVGDIALVDGAGSSLHISEDDGVVLHLPAGILRRICSWITGVCSCYSGWILDESCGEASSDCIAI